MTIPGRVQNGVVVLDGNTTLPEGTRVSVLIPVTPLGPPAEMKRRVKLPFVRSDRPGTLLLTAERVAELLDEEDVPA